MRILGCLDRDNREEIQQAINTLVNVHEAITGLIYVIDSGPRDEIGRKRRQLLRPLRASPSRETRIEATEIATAPRYFVRGEM